VDAEYASGERFTFNDSSTGVRAQAVEYLKTRGRDAAVDTGDKVPVRLVIPRGLRVSEFDVDVQERNRTVTKKARTYYFTTSGQTDPIGDAKAVGTAPGVARTGRKAPARTS